MAKTKRSEKQKEDTEKREYGLVLLPQPYEGYDENEQGHTTYIKKDRRGRPTVMTKQVLQKLEGAFKMGCPDREACIYAGIAEKTLYIYCNKHPDFLQQKEEWKEVPVIGARAVVIGQIMIKKSAPDAWMYLRRKRKQEFSEKIIFENETSQEVVPMSVLERIRRFNPDYGKQLNGQKQIIDLETDDIRRVEENA